MINDCFPSLLSKKKRMKEKENIVEMGGSADDLSPIDFSILCNFFSSPLSCTVRLQAVMLFLCFEMITFLLVISKPATYALM